MKKVALIIAITLVVNAAFTLFLFNHFSEIFSGERLENQPPVHLVSYNQEPPVTGSVPINFSVPEDFVTTANSVTAAVVNISVNGRYDDPISGGSGVIISSNGYIITNNHVIDAGSKIKVTLSNKQSYTATVIGRDKYTDLALIKINASGLPTLDYGDSDDLQVGEWVLAVGNPFNLTSTVTAGIISAKGRNINILPGIYSIESFIQTDAVVNPGNSGGALVNMDGELIGINSAIMSETGSYEGYSFAIPSNLVKKIVRDLQELGTVQRAILGVTILDVNAEIAQDLNLPTIEGVFVSGVNPGSSAESAGLQMNDVIVGINGLKTRSVPELQEQVARFRPGDNVSLDIIRNGRNLKKNNVKLKSLE